LSPPGLSQSALDVAFLINFDRVGKIVVRAELGIVVRAELGVDCWLMAGQIPRPDPIAIAVDSSLAPEHCRTPEYYLSKAAT
jgi:hypothetical protein